MDARDLNSMKNYIERKIKDAKPIPTEAPPTMQYEEESLNEESSEVRIKEIFLKSINCS